MNDQVAIRSTGLRRVAQVAFPFLVLAGLLGVLWSAGDSLTPYLLGFLLIYMLLPVVRATERLLPSEGRFSSMSRPVSAIGAAVAAIVFFLLLLGVLMDPIIDQTSEIFSSFSTYWATIQTEHETFSETYQDFVPDPIKIWIDDHLARVGQALFNGGAGLISWLFNTTGSLVDTGMALVAIPLFVIYYLLDERSMSARFRAQFPAEWSGDLVAVVSVADRVLGSYTRGVMLEAAIVGVITGFGYWLIGVELALALGVIALCGEIVPIIGPWIAFFISFPVVLATQPELAIPAILVFLVIQALEGWFLAPKIQGGAVEFTSSGTLLIIAIGGAVAGALGIVFALPVAALIRALVFYVYNRLGGADPELARSSLHIFAGDAANGTGPRQPAARDTAPDTS